VNGLSSSSPWDHYPDWMADDEFVESLRSKWLAGSSSPSMPRRLVSFLDIEIVEPLHHRDRGEVRRSCAGCCGPCPPGQRWCSESCFRSEDMYYDDTDLEEL